MGKIWHESENVSVWVDSFTFLGNWLCKVQRYCVRYYSRVSGFLLCYICAYSDFLIRCNPYIYKEYKKYEGTVNYNV